MKKRLLALLLAVFTVLSVIPAVSSFADEKTEFSDVPDGIWYYKAVYYALEHKLFSGTGKDTFSPDLPMTRAMLVTVLASQNSVNKDDYKTPTFTDVAQDSWYYAAVEWAYANGIVTGVGSNQFAPNRSISRQELVVMLKKYADFKGIDTTYGENLELSSYADEDAVASWAVSAVRWAVKCGFITGIKSTNDEMLISPASGATRATVAVIMMNFCEYDFPVYAEAGEAKLTINGNDISKYIIIYPLECKVDEKEAALKLRELIKKATGCELTVAVDLREESEYEILVGETNREDGEIDRATLCAEHTAISFDVKVVGNKMFFAGAKDAKSRHGTYYSVMFFAEKYLGFSFYQDDCIVCRPLAEITFDNGFEYIDGPGFLSRETYTKGAWQDCFTNDGYYHILGSIHCQGAWIDSSNTAASKMPCLTKEENIQKVIDEAIRRFNKDPNADAIWISINDSTDYCTCTECMKAYKEDSSRASTIIRLCNRVSEALENAGHKDKKIITIAYNYCTIAPKVTKPCDNVIVYYCTNAACGSHDYSDTTCKLNKVVSNQITAWSSICNEMFIWDYVADFSYLMTPLPNYYSLRSNVKFFYDNKATGLFVNGDGDRTGEFDGLRGYLYSYLMAHPNISDEEYFDRMNAYLRSYYGDTNLYLRKYIDIIEEISNDYDFNFNAPPASFLNFPVVLERMDEIDELWDKAYQQVGNDAVMVERLDECHSSWLYLKLCVLYDSMYTNGTEQQKAEYVEMNRELIERVNHFGFGICVGHEGEKLVCSETMSPDTWFKN